MGHGAPMQHTTLGLPRRAAMAALLWAEVGRGGRSADSAREAPPTAKLCSATVRPAGCCSWVSDEDEVAEEPSFPVDGVCARLSCSPAAAPHAERRRTSFSTTDTSPPPPPPPQYTASKPARVVRTGGVSTAKLRRSRTPGTDQSERFGVTPAVAATTAAARPPPLGRVRDRPRSVGPPPPRTPGAERGRA
jgi:hypothetical protein